MRLWGSTPLFLLTLSQLASTAQVHFEQESAVFSGNLVDALGNDSEYTSLLVLLQRTRLIPTLNKLNGSTLFAPTNDAIKRRASRNALWDTALGVEELNLLDNIQEKLRQELFYHLLNYSLSELPTEQDPQVHRTLHFPHIPVEPPTHDPPPYPPWMPIPGGTLGGEPQRLRISSREGETWVGVDAFGEGGAETTKAQVETSNGILIGIGDVLQVPPDLATVISSHPSLSYLTNILTPETIEFLNTTSELTLFLPVDSAWQALPHYERLYLESKYASDDLTRIVNMHAVAGKSLSYSESFRSGLNLTTIDGPKLRITYSEEDKKTKVSSAELLEPDVYAANGVIHTVSSLLVPKGALRFTLEKYLLVLNCTSFVSLLHSVDLTPLINDTDTHWTILAPRDDVMELWGHNNLPPRGSEELKKMLQYHFIPGKWSPEKLKDRMLLETTLVEEGMGDGRQVLSVDVSEHEKGKERSKSVGFAGAGTIGDPVLVNNTLIYFISRPLVPPIDPLTTALSSLDLSSFLAAVFSTNLAEKLKYTPRTTLLIPHNSAFKRLGLLVSAHLLAASSKADLERVIQHHAITGVEYAESLQNGSQRTYGTLEGSDLHVERKKTGSNSSVLLTASGGWPEMRSTLYPKDTLTQTGVIHEVSEILIPRSVDLTVGKLVRAAKGATMASMVSKAGLDWVLNGTAPPEGTPWSDMGLSGAGWTLLCPTDDAFHGINLTQLYADPEILRDIVIQHFIPTQNPSKAPSNLDTPDAFVNNRPLAFDDSTTYTTLLSGTSQSLFADIVFRDMEGEGIVVGIKGARGADGRNDWAHVVSWGRSTTGGGTGGVIQIDRLLMPYYPPKWVQYGGPVAVGIGGIILICVFFYGVRMVWKRDTTEATYEPVGGFGHEDDET
ncbi:hypothetical protein EW026_g6615 [Hermanssonia centrifuga]|uniref:FAS1 domain-containing protein n=1 Tax=Hermanssonia centrifuga TaxID=98765 RepID=A0A4S4KAG2_9APHY|nr:hypothetical protein EW026_g6615 [Hermanssonia centrifuga]